MASCVGNICVKNYLNPIICFQVTVENVGDVVLGDSVKQSNRAYLGMARLKFSLKFSN